MAIAERKLRYSGPVSLHGVLNWQFYLIAYALGLLAWQEIWGALCAALLLVLLARELRGARLWAFAVVMLAGVGLAAFMASLHPAPGAGVEKARPWMLERQAVVVQGRVAEVQWRDEERLRLLLDDVRCFPGQAREDRLQGRLVFTWSEPEHVPPPGSLLRARLRIAPLHGMANPGAWDYEAWWARRDVVWRAWGQGEKPGVRIVVQGETSLLWTWRETLKERVAQRLQPWLSQGRAAVFALLFGERSWLGQETMQRLRESGVAHSLALSGLHVGFVVLVGFALARLAGGLAPGLYLRLPRKQLGAAAGAFLALVYIWLGGWSPSLMRAALMFFIWGVLYLRGRENTLLDGLMLAVALMLLISPELVYDLRLQLSVIAVLGIAGLLELHAPWRAWRKAQGSCSLDPRLQPHAVRGGFFAPLWQFAARTLPMVLLISVCAQLALLPLLVSTFGELPVSLYLNVLWLPVLGLGVMPLSLSGLVLSLLPWQGASVWAFEMASFMAGAFLDLLQRMDRQGLIAVFTPMRAGWPAWLGYWCALLLFFLLLRGWLKRKAADPGVQGRESLDARPTLQRGVLAAVTLSVALLCVPALRAASRALDRDLSLQMLDVGQGQSLVLHLPGGRRLLLDGGGFAFGTFDVGQAIVAPVLTADRPPFLQGVVLSHHHSDHMLGLAYPLRQFGVGFYADNGRAIPAPTGLAIREALSVEDIERRVWRAGQTLDFGDSVTLEVLHPAELVGEMSERVYNNNSLVLRLTAEGRGLALLPGDIQGRGINALLESGKELKAMVLVLPHHGGHGEAEGELLRLVAPKVVLASAGYLNRYGFPDQALREQTAAQGACFFATSERGAITVRWERTAQGLAPECLVSTQRQGLQQPR